jgi:hypothetical protein
LIHLRRNKHADIVLTLQVWQVSVHIENVLFDRCQYILRMFYLTGVCTYWECSIWQVSVHIENVLFDRCLYILRMFYSSSDNSQTIDGISLIVFMKNSYLWYKYQTRNPSAFKFDSNEYLCLKSVHTVGGNQPSSDCGVSRVYQSEGVLF